MTEGIPKVNLLEMDRPAARKVHFAPLRRQEAAIRRLLRDGRYRDTTQFMRSAIDHYLDRIGHPPLSEQARQMAEDFRAIPARNEHDASLLQDASRSTDEAW